MDASGDHSTGRLPGWLVGKRSISKGRFVYQVVVWLVATAIWVGLSFYSHGSARWAFLIAAASGAGVVLLRVINVRVRGFRSPS